MILFFKVDATSVSEWGIRHVTAGRVDHTLILRKSPNRAMGQTPLSLLTRHSSVLLLVVYSRSQLNWKDQEWLISLKAGFHILEKSQAIGDFTVSRPSQILLIYRQNLRTESSGSTMIDTVFICEGQGKLETSN